MDDAADRDVSKTLDQGEGKETLVDRPDQSEPNPDALPADQEAVDELAEIDGVKPNVYLKDGAETEVGSLTR
jgi:hypothetical protein